MQIKKILLFLTFISFHSWTQEFDETFLASLPEDIREDVLKKAKERDSKEDPIYRNESSMVDKKDTNTDIIIFGENFFSSFQSTFMPINEPNFDSNYVLDYGDVLKIQLIGQKDLVNNFEITRNGSINLPDIGEISLSGLSLKQASDIIKSKIKNAYIGTEVFVSLFNIRDINVLITGNVFKPGIYTLSGNSNPLHALVMAGGLNEFGSYRNIILSRNNEIIQIIDIYDLLIYGKNLIHERMRSGDVIFVNKSLNHISVEGSVKRPATYELKDNENLLDALNYANGISTFADTTKIKLDRINSGKVSSIKIKSLDDLKNVIAKDQDVLNVGAARLRKVSIKGAVENPGSYIVNEGDTLFNLIQRSGGYSKNAYPFGGILNNQSVKETNIYANNKIYSELISLLISNALGTDLSNDLNSFVNIAESLKSNNASGRIVTDFELENRDNSYLLQNGDEIIIPEKINHIYVYGEVSNPGTIFYQKKMTIKSYIDELGGLLDSADEDLIYVILPNGRTVRSKIQKNIFANSKNENIKIYPGSIIFIPRKIDNKYLRRQSIQAYTSILSSLGVSLASISVLKD